MTQYMSHHHSLYTISKDNNVLYSTMNLQDISFMILQM